MGLSRLNRVWLLMRDVNEYAAHVFLQDDYPSLRKFGTGHRVLYVTEGDKWTTVRDASGRRAARILTDTWDRMCETLKPNERLPKNEKAA